MKFDWWNDVMSLLECPSWSRSILYRFIASTSFVVLVNSALYLTSLIKLHSSVISGCRFNVASNHLVSTNTSQQWARSCYGVWRTATWTKWESLLKTRWVDYDIKCSWPKSCTRAIWIGGVLFDASEFCFCFFRAVTLTPSWWTAGILFILRRIMANTKSLTRVCFRH